MYSREQQEDKENEENVKFSQQLQHKRKQNIYRKHENRKYQQPIVVFYFIH